MAGYLITRHTVEVRWDDIENGEPLNDEDIEEMTNNISEELEMGLDAVSRNLHQKFGVTVEVST